MRNPEIRKNTQERDLLDFEIRWIIDELGYIGRSQNRLNIVNSLRSIARAVNRLADTLVEGGNDD